MVEKNKAKNKAATKQAMREAMGEAPASPEIPKQEVGENIITRKERTMSVADKMLTRQMSKYKERFGLKDKSAQMEYIPEYQL